VALSTAAPSSQSLSGCVQPTAKTKKARVKSLRVKSYFRFCDQGEAVTDEQASVLLLLNHAFRTAFEETLRDLAATEPTPEAITALRARIKASVRSSAFEGLTVEQEANALRAALVLIDTIFRDVSDAHAARPEAH
jgi:hypothetical protein